MRSAGKLDQFIDNICNLSNTRYSMGIKYLYRFYFSMQYFQIISKYLIII